MIQLLIEIIIKIVLMSKKAGKQSTPGLPIQSLLKEHKHTHAAVAAKKGLGLVI